jgi:transcription elongation factor GreA
MTTTDPAHETWLTQDAYDRLRAELDTLAGDGRAEISKKIEAAREEGDLKENGGYHAAKEEQGKQEARIRYLEQLLRNAKVGEAPTAEGVAGPGMVVVVRFAGDDEPERFLLGSREDSTSGDLEIYSAQSPIGKALTGAEVGETVSYETPNGKTLTVELLEASPYAG